MHEWIITRDDVRNASDAIMIYVPINCVLVHPGKCHPHGHGTMVDFHKFAQHIIDFESFEELKAWIEYAADIWPHVGRRARHKFNSLYGERYERK